MPNLHYRSQLKRSVEKALTRYADSGDLDHPGLKGRVREIAVRDIIEPLLFEHLKTGTGQLTDHKGNVSAQVDCAVYSTRHLPPILFEQGLGLFPVDATLFAVEIKSRLSSDELRRAAKVARSFRKLIYASGGHSGAHPESYPVRAALFAFESDLRTDGKSELDRYKEIDPGWEADPLLQMICVVGRGFWCFHRHKEGGGAWATHEPSADFDEVIDFMALMTLGIPQLLRLRGQPLVSAYLINILLDSDGNAIRRHS